MSEGRTTREPPIPLGAPLGKPSSAPAKGPAANPTSRAPSARAPGAPARSRVLVVDDEPAVRRSLARVLMTADFEVLTTEDGPAALALLATTNVDVMLLDIAMPALSGIEVLARVKKARPEIEVILMAAFGEVDAAVAAMRAGAYDYLTKPFEVTAHVILALERAAEHKRLLDRTRALERRLEQNETSAEIIGTSAAMQSVHRLALGVAQTTSTVLILGENGTGKKLLARTIHKHSARADKPFHAASCGALPEALVEAELFGGPRDAFPGGEARPGLFELAHQGTLFLAEVSELPRAAQAVLLDVLTEGEIKPRGGAAPTKVDVRVIAATNADLKERVAAGRFREDLYYRLNVLPIRLPALRQRKDDIPLLAYHFLKKHAQRAGREMKRISVESLRQLREQPWPGNVRELENAIEHAVVMARGDALLPGDLPFARPSTRADDAPATRRGLFSSELTGLPYAAAKDRILDVFDDTYIERLMQRTEGNVSEAARLAGMDRSNFRRLLKKVKGAARGPKGKASSGLTPEES